ncbi:UvrD-helicase domain-containing protein [Methanobrevibacter sp.]|uniref:UvrD-helicase domain-containing protein n=1 Tax=Methanobrevibacter sp. TaxID=66852 RepID=UPI003976BB27
MDISNNKYKVKMIQLFCKKYITTDSKGNIKFKSYLNDAIEQGNISDDDALSISLDLMHGIKKYGFNETDIPDELESLILKVSKYNLSENPNIKNSVLFFKDYSYETKVLFEYVNELSPIDKVSTEDNKPQKIKPSEIKKYFNHYSHDDLCYILDIDPDLTFVKDKILKKQIANEFSKYDFDVNKLVDVSSRDIKKYLEELAEKSDENKSNEMALKIKKQSTININHNKSVQQNKSLNSNKNQNNIYDQINTKKYDGNESKNIQSEDKKKIISKDMPKKEFDKLLQKIRLFNHKKLQSMISLKSEYSQIYQFISSENLDSMNNDIKRFRYYYEHFDKIDESIEIIDKIKAKEDFIDKFHTELTSNSSSYPNTNNVILEFKELYKIVHVINEYSYCLKDKIIDEFTNLDYFIENYERLLDRYEFQIDNIKKIELLVTINSFNDKNLWDMVSSKNEYHEIYQKISSMNIANSANEYYIEFDIFIENFEKCEKALNLVNKIKQKEESIYNFFNEINDGEYLPNSRRNEIINKYNDFYNLANQVQNFSEWMEYNIINEFNNLDDFIAYYSDLQNYNESEFNEIRKINNNYIEKKINNHKQLFSDIPDFNKKKAIVTDEDNVKVVAGAGAGKTFIIEKKIDYLIEEGIDSAKILCLCFTQKNVKELSHRLNEKHNVTVSTFHEFCRQVDKKCEGKKTSNRYLLDGIIRKYVADIVNDPKKLARLTEYFSHYSMPPLEEKVFKTLDDYVAYREGLNIRSLKRKFYQCEEDMDTLQGEIVKSEGELLIANYLFMHGIDYIYEKKYPHNYYACMIKDNFMYSGNYFSLKPISDCSNEELINRFIDWEYNRINYKPDFYIPEKDVYIEHFGVNENMEATFLEGEEKEKYELNMYSKEIFHKLYGTKLIKSYFYYLPKDCLIEKLEESLRQNGVTIGQMNPVKIFKALINNERVKDFNNFTKLIKSFINIYESKHIEKANFDEFRLKNTSDNLYNKNRQNLFFDIVEDIYNDYYDEILNGNLSHNHEIINALNLIINKEYKPKFDYIFIDEYQDINPVRCKLLQELQKNSNSKIFVVGDDWQSIYGFAGSDVELFTNFDKYFKNPEVIYIEENRRNPQKLIDITSDFISKNPSQEKKNLNNSRKPLESNLTPIKIVKYLFNNKKSKLLKLDAIITNILEYSKKPEIYILGRNKKDIYDYLGNILFKIVEKNNVKKIIYSEKPDLDIKYMTIHQAKGLDADEVIVLNFEDKYDGFPNKMDDDPILKFVKDENNECEFAEERRLLYVALTRTRNNVYLMASGKFTSTFIDKLIKYNGVVPKNFKPRFRTKNLYYDKNMEGKLVLHITNLKCPMCEDGRIVMIENPIKGTKYIRCSKHPTSSKHYNGGPMPSNYSINDVKYIEKCPSCEGVLIRKGDILRCSFNYTRGCMETKELELDKEDLEFDYE